MKKKVLSLLLVAAMGISMLVGCGSGDDTTSGTEAGGAATNTNKLTVWAPENQQDLLKQQAEDFKAANPDYADFEFEFGIVGEDNAKTEILKDVDAAADVFFFANDQIQELVSAGAISKLGGTAADMVNNEMNEYVASTVTVDGSVYAIPFTHNTFYLFYDKTIMTEEDIKSLDTIMDKDTEDGVFNFLFDGAGGWKLAAWYYSLGCSVYGMDGNDTAAGSDWNNEAGVAATKYLADMHANEKLAVGYDIMELIKNHQLGAWFGGSWDYDAYVKEWGQEFVDETIGCAVLPTFGINGEQVQMKSFYGSKAIGVNAMSKNPAAAVAFATFLASEEQQVVRFEQTQVVPANMKAAEAESIKENVSAVALMAEASSDYSITQPFSADFSADFWDPCSALCDKLKAGELTSDNAEEYMNEWVKSFEK